MNHKLSDDFWSDKVSTSIGKDDVPQDVWNRIVKIRNSPIRLIRDLVIGEYPNPHKVLSKGLKGYLIDFPEVFYLSKNDLERMSTLACSDRIPATILGYGEIVFLTDDDYEIVSPFFDMSLADYAIQYRQ